MEATQSTTTPASTGRPAGEVRQALLQACEQLHTPDRSPTLRELAQAAKVSLRAATDTVKNLKRAGLLHKARDRRVEYRNRPVAEYMPSAAWAGGAGHAVGSAALASVLQTWGR